MDKKALQLPTLTPSAPFSTLASRGFSDGIFSIALVLMGAMVLAGILLVKGSADREFLTSPILFFYSYFITVFELSRIASAIFYNKVTGPLIEASYANGIFEPSVSFVIPCMNEEGAIANTITKCFEADYPKEKVEVIVINDGSTDGTAVEIKKMQVKFKNLIFVDWKENRGKRHGMAEGFKMAGGEIIVQLDSDSYIEPKSFRNLIAPFANPEIGAVCAHADPENADVNMLTRMQSAYYFLSFRILKAAESTFLTVFCCSGCSSAYRKSVVLPIIDTWMNERFLGKPITWGDDRALTNWVLRKGFHTIYTDKAKAYTLVPTKLRQFLKQQVRWKKGWFVNSVFVAGFIIQKRPFVALTYFFPLILATIFTPFMAAAAMFYSPIVRGVIPLSYFMGILLMASAITIYYRYIARDNKYWPYVFLWAAFNSILLSYILFYALFRLNDRKWNTR